MAGQKVRHLEGASQVSDARPADAHHVVAETVLNMVEVRPGKRNTGAEGARDIILGAGGTEVVSDIDVT